MADSDTINILRSIRELKEAEPFAPFVIICSSGDRYRIEAPANLVEMKADFFYAFPGGEKFVFIRMNQIIGLEGSRSAPRSKRRKAS